MTDQEATLTAQLAAAGEPRDTERASPPESEHDALLRAIRHMTDAVLRVDATMLRLERAISMLADAVEQCPVRPYPVALASE